MIRPPASRDCGFTLTETLIVVAIIGLVGAVIAATFSVIVRTTPVTEDRTDDARSLLGLTTWLPQDVMSTRVFRYTSDTPLGCGSTPGDHLLELEWSQSSATYRVNYRYVQDGQKHYVKRFSCVVGGSVQELKLTSNLPRIGGAVPIDVTPKPGGLEFEVTIVDDSGVQREILSIDAFTENVPGTLPPLPPDPTAPPPTTSPNQAPIALDYTYPVHPDVDTDLVVQATDANNDSLTGSILAGAPAWATMPGSLDLRVHPTAADVGSTFLVRVNVQDPGGLSDVADIQIQVVPTANTTTTTSTTTTTTSIPGCVASIQSVNPSTSANANNKGDPVDVGKLEKEIRVSIASNGFCGPLVLTFDPDPQAPGPDEVLAFNNASTVILPKSLLWRDSGATPHPLLLKVGGANGTVLHSATLTVT